jgi:S-formylglutathione hydrolase FrmB
MSTNIIISGQLLDNEERAAIDSFCAAHSGSVNLPGISLFLQERFGASLILEPDVIAGFSTDSSNLPGRADALARPASERECAAILRTCHVAGIPITVSGGKSNLTGSATPQGGVVLSTVKLVSPDADVDLDAHTVATSPGVILEDLRKKVLVISKGSLTPENCRRVEFSLPSASMDRAIRVAVLLPPGFETGGDKTYPFLYALHGMDAPYDTWTQMIPLRKLLKDHPMVLVAFDGDPAGWYIDAPEKKDSQFETFFFKELSPLVERTFRCNGRRAVTGFSMGGFGAMNYMLSNPGYFTSVSALSGALRRPADYEPRITNRLKPLVGLYEPGAPAYTVFDIDTRLKELLQAGKRPPPLFFACGANDFLLEANRRIRDTLAAQNQLILDRLTAEVAGIQDEKERRLALRKLAAEKQINYIYEESPGGHDFTYWSAASERVGLFHWKYFQTLE